MQDLSLKQALRAEAMAAGFVKMGICRPDAAPETAARLAAFVDAGQHGQMGWMAERMGWRGNAAALWPEARSVIMLAEAYTPLHDPLAVLEARDRGAISVYAQGRDYHDIVKKRLKRVARWLLAEVGRDDKGGALQGKEGLKRNIGIAGEPSHRVRLSSGLKANPTAAHSASSAVQKTPEVKVFVDTAPVMEKPLAQAAGLGWQGKHTNLLGRDLGNWVFLGAIFTTVEIEPDAPEVDHCGSCRACLDICPTDAFAAPYQLDARRCISYLTIEHKGAVAADLRAKMGNRIYGCDDCLAACPWNKFAVQARELRYFGDAAPPPLAELVTLDDAGFRARFAGSPVKRIGRDRFVRNVLYAIGNSGDTSLAAAAQALANDPDPAVADAARWAVTRLHNGG